MQSYEILTYTLGIIFLISGSDDLLIDLVHFFKRIKVKKLNAKEWKAIDQKPERTIAIMVPAWEEYDVIDAMVRTNIARIRYDNYQWFLGVYPNDEKTKAIALNLKAQFPEQVNVVVADRNGPTTKAHCLNNIFEVIKNRANSSNGRWMPEYIAIHDAEDVIHPDSLKAVNSMYEDFIQIPVFSIETPYLSLVSSTYMDEFAESHLKEIPAREALGMPIPSAGVGTFFSLHSLLSVQHQYGFTFNESSLTEDYELSMRIARMGFSQKFLVMMERSGKSLLATRGYFPSNLMTSIRQKTRWITGITLQTPAVKSFSSIGDWYGQSRDRKGVVTNLINLLGWVAFVSTLSLLMLGGKIQSFQYPEVMNAMVMANLAIFCVRIIQRFRFTTKVYGPIHGLIAIPRVLLLNLINSLSTVRAIYRFYTAPKSGLVRQVTWDKTEHRFPTPATIGDEVETVTPPPFTKTGTETRV